MLNRQVTLEVVYDIAKRITAKYGADGYVLSRAIVPPQELTPGGATIRIQVIEGYVSRVEWPREKLARYRDFFTDYTAKIIADRPTNIRTLERYLLLANDLPGLKFTTTLQASKTEQGAAVLIVEVTEKPIDVQWRASTTAAPRRAGRTSSWSRRPSTICPARTRRSRSPTRARRRSRNCSSPGSTTATC